MTSTVKLRLWFFLAWTVVSFSASAAPLPLSVGILPDMNGVGQTTLVDFSGTRQVHVDWMVTEYVSGSLANLAISSKFSVGSDINATETAYLYLYQLENPNNNSIATLTISLSAAAGNSILGAGVIDGDDLDLASDFHPAHSHSEFGGLSGEFEGTTHAWPVVTHFDYQSPLVGSNLTWTNSLSELASGAQSNTFFYVSTLPPAYGNAYVINGSTWSSLFPGSDKLPVPVPEPGTIILAIFSCAAGVFFRHRRGL